MKSIVWTPLLLAVSSLASGAESPVTVLEQTKALCRDYSAGFVHPEIELAYGKRINGPRGIGALESVEAVANLTVHGEHRPWGYGSGIEDLAYQNGMLIYALCDAEAATGEPLFAEMAQRAFRGLKRMSTISPVSGFIPRGPHPADGKTYYPDSSLDQHSLYVCGLWRFHNSRLSSPENKQWIEEMIVKVTRRLEKNHWSFLVEDDSRPSQAGGDMLPMRPAQAALLLAMLAVTHQVTGDSHWLDLYDRFGSEEGGRRWKLLAKEDDPKRPARYNNFSNQDMLRTETLRRIEPDPDRRGVLRRRIVRTAEGMLTSSYFKQWTRMWLMSESWAPGASDEVANAYLKPLGINLESEVTVMDMWQRFNQDLLSPEMLPGQRNRYEPMTLAVPALVWQIALLSQDPGLIRQVRPAVEEMFERVDFDRIDLGWTYNYAVLAALWNVAGLTRG